MALTITTATVETAAPTEIILTFSDPLCVADNLVVTVDGNVAPLKAPSVLFGSTARIQLLKPVANGEAVLVAFLTAKNSTYGIDDVLNLTAQAVSNNVA